MLIIVLMLCSFAVATAEFVVVGLLPQIAADVSVSIPAAGQLVTAYMLVVTIGGPAATVLTRRLPRRGLLGATMALATGAPLGSAFAGSYGVLLVARLGSALAQTLFMAVASQVAMAAGVGRRGARHLLGACVDQPGRRGARAGGHRRRDRLAQAFDPDIRGGSRPRADFVTMIVENGLSGVPLHLWHHLRRSPWRPFEREVLAGPAH